MSDTKVKQITRTMRVLLVLSGVLVVLAGLVLSLRCRRSAPARRDAAG